MPHRQRVMWLIKGLARGGAERLVSAMAPRIDRTRFEVEVAYLVPEADAFVPDLEGASIRVHCLQARGNVEPRWPARLQRLLREGHYEIVHSHSPLVGSVARLVAPRGTRHFYTEHNMWDVYRWPTFAANAVSYTRNERVFAVSGGVATSIARPWWARIGRMPPVETLLHGVDVASSPHGREARAAARARLGISPDIPVFGNVANFSPKKDQATLLRAFATVRERVPKALLLLIGMGPLEDHLRRTVRDLGATDAVRFLGSRDDVAELLPALDVFVLSSTYEGLPISLLEAMAAEIACVCTAVGGIPEALRDGVDGRLVPPAQSDVLAEALREVMLDTAQRQRLGSNGRSRVSAEFDLSRAVERQEQQYATTDRQL